MRVLHIHSLYNFYLKSFYLKHPKMKSMSYSEALKTVENDFMDWGRGYVEGLSDNGVEAEHLIIPDTFTSESNLLTRLWAEEHLSSERNYPDLDIVVEQVKHFHPDVVLFFAFNEELFSRLKDECPFVKKFIGWIGSALSGFELMKKFDLLLCCAPENIEKLQSMGINAVHVNHAFNPKINDFLSNDSQNGAVFIGQIIRGSEYHLLRERILLETVRIVPIRIYSPSCNYGKKRILKVALKRGVYYGNNFLNGVTHGKVNDILRRIPRLDKIAKWEQPPMYPINLELVKYLQPPVWGMEMFDVLNEAAISLNIHADSSPLFASNMRLFEATGVGSCLLTDRKRNINDMFEEDKECVVYDNAEDCAEKVKWLLEHPLKRQEIAKAGQMRCLRDYTNKQQGEIIIQHIKSIL